MTKNVQYLLEFMGSVAAGKASVLAIALTVVGGASVDAVGVGGASVDAVEVGGASVVSNSVVVAASVVVGGAPVVATASVVVG